MMISPCIYHVFKILIFGFVSWVTGQKVAQNEKKLCCTHISGTMHHMISFMVHMCKIIVSLCFFSFFQNFNLPGCWWVKAGTRS